MAGFPQPAIGPLPFAVKANDPAMAGPGWSTLGSVFEGAIGAATIQGDTAGKALRP